MKIGRAKARHLHPAVFGVGFLAGLGVDGFALAANFGGADFAHGGVAGEMAGAPHVPACEGAVGAPALAEG